MKCVSMVMVLAVMGAMPAFGQATQPAATAAAANEDRQASEQQLVQKAERLQTDLSNCTGSRYVNLELLRKRFDDELAQHDAMERSMDYQRDRLEVVSEKVARLTDEAKVMEEEDKILVALKSMAKQRDEDAAAAQKMSDKGNVASNEVHVLMTAAAEAHVKVEERREALLATVGGGILPALNKELVMLSIESTVAEREMRRSQQKREELKRGLEISSELLNLHDMLMERFKHHVNVME